MNPLYLLICLQVADLITTVLCLRTGKAREANALLARLMAAIGMVPALVLIKGAFIAVLFWAAPQVDPALLWLASAGYGLIIWNNLRVLQRLG